MIDYINQGNEVVLVSGRNYFISNRVKKRIKNDIDMIACNGSVIYKGDELIFDSPMDHKKVYDFYLENCKNKEKLVFIQ